jgi:hypothetical protein
MSSPVLPVHAQDSNKHITVTVPDPSAYSPRSTKSAFFRSPPPTGISGISGRTGLSARTGYSARTGRSGFSTQSAAAEALDVIVIKLEEETEETKELFNLDEPDQELTDDDHKHPQAWVHKINHFRAHLRHILHVPAFHYTIIGMVMFDLIVVFIDVVISLLNLPCFTDVQLEKFRELGVDDPPESTSCILHESNALIGADWFLWGLSVFLLSCFMLEVIASLFAFGPRHFKKPLYAIDGIVVTASLVMEIFFRFGDHGKLGDSPSALIVLRLWKIVRAIHAIAHSIELKNQAIIQEVQAAKAQVEEEHHQASEALERDHLKIQYLRTKVPEVQDTELEEHVEKVIEKLQLEAEEEDLKLAKGETEEKNASSNSSMDGTHD